MASLSIQEVLDNRNSYNLALPFVETHQINPFYKMSVLPLYVDVGEHGSQIYKVGSKYTNGKWTDLFSLTKPFLNKLATEAGVQFAPNAGDVVKVDDNTWKASAFGAIRLPDGTIRTSNNFKIIDLVTEEKKYRLVYEEKAEKGISEFKAAEDAAKKYVGNWFDTGRQNEKGYPIRTYIISEQDRGRYIENSLLDAMTQLRANAPQKAATGAILRVIRDLLGIKGTYTMEELKKPFVVARTSFSPDYNDPAVRQMLLQQAMQSVGNLFGNVQPVVQTISIPPIEIDDEFDVPNEEIALSAEGEKSRKPEEMPEDRTMDFRCDKCNEVIPMKVWGYSMEHYDRPLCYKCQKIIRGGQKGGRQY